MRIKIKLKLKFIYRGELCHEKSILNLESLMNDNVSA